MTDKESRYLDIFVKFTQPGYVQKKLLVPAIHSNQRCNADPVKFRIQIRNQGFDSQKL